MAAEADLVHFHFPWPMMDLVHFATRHGRPTVLRYHSDIIKQRTLLKLYGPLMNQLIKSMDRILVESPNYLESNEKIRPVHRLEERHGGKVCVSKVRSWRTQVT